MRILFLTQWFQPEPIFKGLPFARALQARGHEVEVLTGFPNYPGGKLYPGYRVRGYQREEMEGVPVHRVALYPSHDGSAVRRVANYLSFAANAALSGSKRVQRPDVVYVYNLVTLGWASRALRARYGCKIVLDVQDLWPESVTTSGMLPHAGLQRMLERWCAREYAQPDHLVAQSPGFKRLLMARGVPESRISVIYNWCDEMAITCGEPDPATAARFGFTDRFNVVFAGTMGKAQALDAALDAAALLLTRAPKVLLTFVGGGIEVDRLRAAAEGRGLSNVQFLPRMPMSEIGQVLAQADALLIHLKRDPLFAVTVPSKVQAYLYAGKPVIVGVEGDAARLVEEAQAGVACAPEDAGQLADAVCGLAALPAAELQAMGGRARAFYHDRLSMARGVQQFEQIFTSVVEAG